jgi:flagellin-like hook-associated protein FlgL
MFANVTDIATESTRYASLLVQQQAGIAVLAQAQSLSSSLLELVRVKLSG